MGRFLERSEEKRSRLRGDATARPVGFFDSLDMGSFSAYGK